MEENPNGSGGVEELGGVEGGESAARVNYVRKKKLFSIKGERPTTAQSSGFSTFTLILVS